MLERWTPQAKVLWQRAEEEARRYGHAALDPDHLLLALVKEESEGVAEILRRRRIDPYEIWQETRRSLPEASPSLQHGQPLPMTPGVLALIEAAQDEADRLRHGQVSSEHLFLALLRQRDEPASQRLAERGLDLEAARAIVRSRPGPVDQEHMLRPARRPESFLNSRGDMPAPLASVPSITLPAPPQGSSADLPDDAQAKPLDWQLQMTQILLATMAGLMGGYLLYGGIDGMAGVGMAAFVLALFRNSLAGALAGVLLGFVLADRRSTEAAHTVMWILAGGFVGSFMGNFWRRYAPGAPRT